jgi:hypothetical protein
MTKKELFRIGYVDDDIDDIDFFCRFAKNCFEVETLQPTRKSKIDDIVEWVKDSKISAIIVDYDLKEKDSVGFLGSQVVEKVQEEFLNFPSFILTNYEDKAVNGTKDSDLIFDKYLNTKKDDNKAEILKKRIRNKITSYKDTLKNAEKEYSDLVKKKNMTLRQEDRLLELDSFIEKSKGKKGHISEILKTNNNCKKLGELIKKADMIIAEIKKKKC